MNVLIINGPNLNLLGTRETSIYGNRSMEDYLVELKERHPEVNIGYFQSNLEGALIDALQQAVGQYDGVILNAAGYSHTSVSLADAIAGIDLPVVEVHISNIYSRETFRHTSLTAAHCIGCMTGFGLKGYEMAVRYLYDRHHS